MRARAEGKLLLHSPLAMTAERRTEVEAPGSVSRYAPNLFHPLDGRLGRRFPRGAILLVDHGADEVGGQQIRSELDARELGVNRVANCAAPSASWPARGRLRVPCLARLSNTG
jgi:hypothetical protein